MFLARALYLLVQPGSGSYWAPCVPECFSGRPSWTWTCLPWTLSGWAWVRMSMVLEWTVWNLDLDCMKWSVSMCPSPGRILGSLLLPVSLYICKYHWCCKCTHLFACTVQSCLLSPVPANVTAITHPIHITIILIYPKMIKKLLNWSVLVKTASESLCLPAQKFSVLRLIKYIKLLKETSVHSYTFITLS